MIRYLYKFLKKVVFSFLFIYSADLLLHSFGVIVPINYWTILCVVLLGCPGFIMLALSFLLL